ncbi:DUF6629 family protein [Solicola sp. PLA-1-18]|uniref:DUF6629 family protein n=1 Tax=Solicola sp. PLA-1-18 TaxID=3380532 RepID=UPI003B7B267B
MCLSPEVDLAAGVVIGAVAVEALRRRPVREDLPLALVPAVLAFHSFVEAFVWWGGRGQVGEGVFSLATHVYVLIAYVVLPTLVPFAIRAREPLGRRRDALSVALGVGIAVSATMLWATLDGDIAVTLEEHFVRYGVGVPFPVLVVSGYVVVTCGSTLLSSSRAIRIFGVVNVVAVAVLALVTTQALTSLWCGWAAITSVAIVLQVRRDRQDPSRVPDRAPV